MFKKFLEAFINKVFHRHEYEIIEKVNLFDSIFSKMPVAKKYILRCKTCGEITSRRV